MKSLVRFRQWLVGLTTMVCVSSVEGCTYGIEDCIDEKTGINIPEGAYYCADDYAVYCQNGTIYHDEECPVNCSKGVCTVE